MEPLQVSENRRSERKTLYIRKLGLDIYRYSMLLVPQHIHASHHCNLYSYFNKNESNNLTYKKKIFNSIIFEPRTVPWYSYIEIMSKKNDWIVIFSLTKNSRPTRIDKIHTKIDYTNRKLKWNIMVKRVMAIGRSSA